MPARLWLSLPRALLERHCAGAWRASIALLCLLPSANVWAEEPPPAGDPFAAVAIVVTDDVGSCVDGAEVRERLRRNWGNAPIALSKLEAEFRAQQADRGIALEYRARHDQGASRRSLVLSSCEEAVEAAALLLQLTLDPTTRGALAVDPEPAPAAEPALPAEPTRPVVAAAPTVEKPPPPAPPSPKKKSFFVALAAGASVLTSLTPSVGLGPSLDASFGVGILQFRAGGDVWAVLDVPIPETPGGVLHSTAWGLRGDVGLAFPFGRFALVPYLGAALLRLDAAASGVMDPAPGGSFFSTLRAGLTGRWAASRRFGLAADCGAAVPLERPSFWLNGLTTPVHRPEIVGFEGRLQVFVSWGSQFQPAPATSL